MKKLQLLGLIMLIISLAGFILWRFIVTLPDWLIRADMVLMLFAVFITSFSTTKVIMNKRMSN